MTLTERIKRWLTDPTLSNEQIRQELDDYYGEIFPDEMVLNPAQNLDFKYMIANQITADRIWVDKPE